MRTTFSVVNNTFLSKAGSNKIRSGDIFSIKIIDNKNGLITTRIKGNLITFKGSASLKLNTILKVRAAWRGNTLVLDRIEENRGLKKWISTYGIKENPAAVSLFEAVNRSGGHLQDDTLRLLKRLLRKKKEITKEESRTAAELVKKGLSPEEMLSITSVFDGHEEKNKDKALLFNHIADGDELWFIVPYSFSTDELKLDGSIRIKKSIKSKEIQSAVIDVSVSGNRYFFLISNFSGKNRRLMVFTDGKIGANQKKQIKKLLPEILGNLFIKIDDNIIEDCFSDCSPYDFDGFSAIKSTLSGVEEVV